jgi:hypothetical protein
MLSRWCTLNCTAHRLISPAGVVPWRQHAASSIPAPFMVHCTSRSWTQFVSVKHVERHNSVAPLVLTPWVSSLEANSCIIHNRTMFNLLKPTGHVMHQQFNIQQLYALPTLYLCVLYLSENKQRLVPLINWLVFITEMKSFYCAVRTRSLNKGVCAAPLKG